uniref:ATPase_AAA_core domain-containing protein n=1 Tax=Steinernema glaseri TaxID=37863 RepID=A0A1I8AN96_9BILA
MAFSRPYSRLLLTAASKLAIRLAPDRLSCIDLASCLSASLEPSTSDVVDRLNERINQALKSDVRNLVVFDDVSCLEAFSGEVSKALRINNALKSDIKNLVVFDDVSCLEAFSGEMSKALVSRMLLSLKARMTPGSLIVAATKSGALPVRSDFTIRISPVGTGFSKDISAEVVIENSAFKKSAKKTYHACIRDRSVKFFVPGSVRPLS